MCGSPLIAPRTSQPSIPGRRMSRITAAGDRSGPRRGRRSRWARHGCSPQPRGARHQLRRAAVVLDDHHHGSVVVGPGAARPARPLVRRSGRGGSRNRSAPVADLADEPEPPPSSSTIRLVRVSPRPVPRSGGPAATLLERVEDPLLVRAGDAHSRVRHGDLQSPLFARARDPDLPAVRGEPHRVVEQLEQHLLDLARRRGPRRPPGPTPRRSVMPGHRRSRPIDRA